MAKTIIGLDVGSWSIKVVEIEPRDGTILGFEESIIPHVGEESAPTGPSPTSPPPMSAADEEGFEEAATEVREAPEAPEESGEADEAGEVVEPIGQAELDPVPWRAAFAMLPNLEEITTADRLLTAMPEADTTIVRIPVPFEEVSKVKNILPHLLEDRLPMPLDSVVWSFRVMPALNRAHSEEEPFEALVALAAKSDIRAHLDELSEAGIDPSFLLVPELTLAAVQTAAWQSSEAAIAVLDIGHETTNLVVVSEGRVAAARSIRTGGRKLTDRIADSFGVDFEEAERIKHEYAAVVEGEAPNEQMSQLSDAVIESMRPVVRDVRRTLQSTFARDRIEVEKVLLVGGTSVVSGLDRHLGQALGIEVERLTIEGFAGSGPAASRAAMSWALARTGVDDALRGAAINLRRGEFSYRGRSSYLRAQILKFGAVALLFFGLIFILLFAQRLSQEAQRDAMRAALRDETKELFGEPVTSENQIKMRLEGEGGGAEKLVPDMSAYELTYEVVTRISSDLDLDLTRLEVDVDRNVIQIRGDTTDATAVDSLVTDLEKLECLKEIKKEKLTVRGGRADFELQINSGCS